MQWYDDCGRRSSRKQWLITNAPLCPGCYSTIVDLVDFILIPANWHCVECGMNFPYEPGE